MGANHIQALELLKQGNAKFTSSKDDVVADLSGVRRDSLVAGQSPYAAILTCADSRTPPEHIFGAGLGELFVCRNAGNLVNDVVTGSFEYAVAHTGCNLICILGHERCGAMGAAVQAAGDPSYHETPAVDAVIRHLMPAVVEAKNAGTEAEALVDEAAKLNLLEGKRRLLAGSELLRDKVTSGQVNIVCAWYELSTGRVSFLKS
jgi:carbonic anhydrase